MNFDLTGEQEMVRNTFARFLAENSSPARVRAAMTEADGPAGFDPALWQGLARLGAFALRVPEHAGGLGLGLFEAVVMMEEAGRALVSGPLAEALVATRLLAQLGGQDELVASAMGGETLITIAMQDVAALPRQWVAGALAADAVIARNGNSVVLVQVPAEARASEETLATTALTQLDLGALPQTILGRGYEAIAAFAAGLEEWKLLMASALSGLSREALHIAAAYASERKAFGTLIGTFQALSHPMADLICEIDSAKFLVWNALRSIADGNAEAAAQVSLAAWWSAGTAGRTGRHAVQTLGGIGLTLEHDLHLYALRSKAWPLVAGDPEDWLAEAGRRLYAGENASLPDVGDVQAEFDLGDDARRIQEEIREFFARNVTDEQRKTFHFSWEGHNAVIHKQLVEANLAYLQLPKDVGGRGLSPYEVTAASFAFEKEGWTNPVANVAEMVALIMYRFGSDELKRDLLSKVMSGDSICSLGYSEPGCGSDVFAAQCKATQLADGSWRIDGTKMWTSGANLTDYVLILCRTNPDALKHKGLTMFIVPLKAEGVTVQGVHTFIDERTNITFYDNVRIPDSWRLGAINDGARTMAASLELEHGGGFATAQRSMLESAVKLCREIPASGGKLIDTPKAQMRLARTYANTLAADLLAFRANWAQVRAKGNGAYGPMAKVFSSEQFVTDSRDLLDLTAPCSLSKRKGPQGVVNLEYRHAHGTTIYGGTSQVHRSMIAEKGLGLPRSRN